MARNCEFKGQKEFLSNMYNHNICFHWRIDQKYYDIFQPDGAIYPSSENLYQALKCENFESRKLFQECNPFEAKQLGKVIKIRKDWEQVKILAMELVTDLKYQNYYLVYKLLSLPDDIIVERNDWGDTFWGECNGKGFNHLGKILTNKKNQLKLIYGDVYKSWGFN